VAACGHDTSPPGHPVAAPTASPPTDRSLIIDIEPALAKRRCEVHGVATLEDVVPIEYGEVLVEPEFKAARARLFPNAANVFGGGCMPLRETHAHVRYCPRCREAKRTWMAAHPGIRELGDSGP
jgi:hypothetical protein